MRLRKGAVSVLAATVIAVGFAAGCVESEPDEARTPAGASTAVNSALQTDSEGKTVSAPAIDPSGAGGSAGEGGGQEAEGGGQTPGGGGPTTAESGGSTAGGDPAAGQEVFLGNGCGGCHTQEQAGTNASIGPNLSEALQGQSSEDIKQQIVDPNSEVTEGFPPGVMPQNYENQLSPTQLNDLVAFLLQ